MAAALFLAPLAGAVCEEPAKTTELLEILERAEWAYGGAELDVFNASSDLMLERLPCVDEEVPRNIAARIHRLQGLRGFVVRDPDLSTRAFAAARSIEPGYRFPETIVPQGNPVLADYEAIPVESGLLVPALAPKDGYLLFDGRPGTQRPGSWPSLLQIVDEKGQISLTVYLRRSEALPEYKQARVQPIVKASNGGGQGETEQKRGVSVPLLVTAGGLAVASGTLLALSRGVEDQYWDNSYSNDELEDLRQRHNGLALGAWGSGGGAVLAGVGAFLVVRW